MAAEWLRDRAVRDALYEYMGGILKALDSKAIRINGVEDHVHIVCLLSRNHALKKIIEKVKTASSKWIKTKGPRLLLLADRLRRALGESFPTRGRRSARRQPRGASHTHDLSGGAAHHL